MKANKRIWVAPIGLLTLAAALIVIGVIRQEYTEVFQKAVKICLECIGIG